MKTKNTYSELLHKLCKRSNPESQFRKRSKGSMILVLLAILMMPLQNVKADYFYQYNDYFKVTKTVGNEAGALDIQLIALDKEGDNDRMKNTTLSYSLDGINWEPIFSYNVVSQAADGSGELTNYTFTPSTSSPNSLTTLNKGFCQKISLCYPALYPNQAYLKVKWYYPAKIKGKKIYLALQGTWQRNYASSSDDDVLVYNGNTAMPIRYTQREIQLKDFSPNQNTSCSISSLQDGKFNFSWTSADSLLTKFEIYSDNYTTLKGTVLANSINGAGSVKLDSFNVQNSYTVKQVYETSSTVPGFSIRYEKNLGEIFHPGYSFPTKLSTSFNPCTRSTTLTWTNTNPVNSSAGFESDSKIYVYRKRSDQTYYTQQNTVALNRNAIDFTDNSDLLYDKTYSYIVRSYPTNFDVGNSSLTSENTRDYLSGLVCEKNLTTARKIVEFKNFEAVPKIGVGSVRSKIYITWKEDWCADNTTTIKIHRLDKVGNVASTFVVPSKDLKYDDADVQNENRYDYRLEINNDGIPVFSPWDSINVITDKAEFVRFTTTKGVYNDRVKLLWEIDKPELNTKYIVRRKISGDSIYTEVYEKQSTSKIESWEDLSVAPGILYQYQVESYYSPITNSNVIKRSYTPSSTGLGFCQPNGTVSGSISYGSGTSVENVNVSIENNDPNQQLYSCLNFKDENVSKGEGYIEFQKLKHGCIHTGFTWQAWLKPQNRTQSNAVIYELKDEYSIRINNNNIEIYVGSASSPVITAGIDSCSTSEFFHLSLAYNPTANLLELYINGALKNTATLTVPSCSNPELATAKLAASFNALLNHYKGSIDEMRLWNRRLTAVEITKNFDRYLSGTETDLIGYWQMDEGIDTYAFDRSNKSKIYNEHHIVLSKASTSILVPSISQLSIKATTDLNGNYIIQGVPYKGNGSSYHVTPMLGDHNFQPASQLIFLGSTSSEIQSKIDFSDISSFTIKGKIVYENTNYPVEGVEFFVDGQACIQNNKPAKTNENGEYSIEVPIGIHTITLSMTGHKFADSDLGRSLKMGVKYNFSENKNNIDFVDQTKVTLVGRVVGGKVQASKPIGFNRSHANIGKAKIELQLINQKYALYYKGTNDSLEYTNSNINVRSTAKVASSNKTPNTNKNIIVINTDSINGEFLLEVPPVPMNVKSIRAGNIVFDAPRLENIPSINMDPVIIHSDTIHRNLTITGGKKTMVIDSVNYHQRLNLTYIVDKPEFTIMQVNKFNTQAFGDTLYSYEDLNTPANSKMIPLYVTNSLGEIQYKNSSNLPIFTKGNPYTFRIRAYEKYKHPGHAEDQYDIVPLDNSAVNIINNLSTNTSRITVILDSLGVYDYKFKGGEPAFGNDLSKGMTAQLDFGVNGVAWMNGSAPGIKGIVIGSVPTGGVDIVTKGPDDIIAILRDPPGSNSFATLDKGSVVTNTRTYKGKGKEDTKSVFTLSLGCKTDFFGIEVETTNDIGGGIHQRVSGANGTTNKETYSFNQTVSTSASPEFVGAEGDVFIATSTNIAFARCNQMNIVPGSTPESNYTFVPGESYLFAPVAGGTSVFYTQSHIVNKLIPNLRSLRASILDSISGNLDSVSSGINSKYVTNLSKKDPGYGTKGTYRWVRPTVTKKGDFDQVQEYTNFIKQWENLIRQNEMEKIVASGKTPYYLDGDSKSKIKYDKENISFDAGVVRKKSITRTSNTVSSHEVDWEIDAVVETNQGFKVNGFGLSLKNEVEVGGGEEKSTIDETENSVTYSYTLEDRDAGNYFSVDVHTPHTQTVDPDADINMNKTVKSHVVGDVESEGGPIFITVGGQSSCPYEKGDQSLFYKNALDKTVPLNSGTFQVEKPAITIENPIVSGIASGKEATFELNLKNDSQTNTAVWYELKVDETSNPNGAIISIDGSPLTQGRRFLIESGATLRKTVRLSQSRTDVLNYTDIRFVFSSICQSEINASAAITAKFVPSCSDLTMQIDTLVRNVLTGSNVQIKLKGFDRSYRNFAGIQVHYREVGGSWTLAKEFIINKLLLPKTNDNKVLVGNDTTFTFAMKELLDQTYEFRARTICKIDNDFVYNETPIVKVLKDMTTPRSMGVPSPSNGILTPETEVSVTFSEPIQTSKLISDNVQVWGVLNGQTVPDNVGLQFNGLQTAFTESPINLKGSFSIEGKVRIDSTNTNGTIFSLGEGNDSISLRAVKNDLIVKVGSVENRIPLNNDPSFQYFALGYNAKAVAGSKNLTLRLFSSANAGSGLTEMVIANGVAPVGRLKLGNNFKGAITQFSIWNDVRGLNDIQSDRSKSKTGNEINLLGYWPMDEGYGKLAVDKARSRNLTVNGSWFIAPVGKAISLNGTNQILINSSRIPIVNDNDFGLEFWFNGALNQKNATLLFCGKEDVDKAKNLSLAFNNDGNLVFVSDTTTHLISANGLLDNDWHHFAMSVMRGGNANFYIDGSQKYSTSASNIGGIESDFISFGARRYQEPGRFDNRFVGSFDEIRIWKKSITAENIRLDMHSKLTGKETDLLAYYPFERSNSSNDIDSTLLDKKFEGSFRAIVANGNFISNTPAIKDVRKRVKVNSSITASDNKIVINLQNSDAKLIENCILEFEVSDVLDLNGNPMSSALPWTAFVDMNRLKWDTEPINLTKEVLSPLTFNATISNSSGKYENYVISGLPSWLSVSKEQGTLNPMEKKVLLFTIDPAINVGSYECNLRLTGSKNIDEMLSLSLKVTGTRPDWSVNPYDFESSMNITGKVLIDSVAQEDTDDMLAAFIGNRCVGITHPVFNKSLNGYIVYMDVYSLSTDEGKSIKFSLWDAGTGRIYPDVEVATPILYSQDAMIGNISNIKLFNATDKIEQQLSLKQGWNWISTNVVNTTNPLLNQFKTGLENTGIQIKSRDNGFINYAVNVWDGSLSALNQTSMYMVKTNQAKTVKLIGAMAKPADVASKITINEGWNWIGYVPQFVAPVKDAMAGFVPFDGDQIKGQLGFATYSNGVWNGSLQYLTPGLGYMYHSGNSTSISFAYPSQYLGQSRVMRTENKDMIMKWEPNVGKYQQSMTITAVISIDNNEAVSSDMQLGVFINDECRGSVALQYVENYNRYIAYLMIWGNAEDANKKLTFKCFDQTNDKVQISSDATVSYLPNTIIGSSLNPYLVQIRNVPVGNINLTMDQTNIYPNPVDGILFLKYDPKGIEKFEIVDNLGRVQYYSQAMSKNSVDVGHLMPGVYTVSVRYNGVDYKHRLIKK